MYPRYSSDCQVALTPAVPSRLVKLLSWIGTPRGLVAASFLRIGFGLVVLSELLLQFRNRELMWGPRGLIPWNDFHSVAVATHQINIFAFNSSDAYFQFAYFSCVVVTIAYTAGYLPRLTAVLFAVCTWSLYHRDVYTINGGSKLLTLLVLYLAFAEVGHYMSVSVRKNDSTGASVSGVFHNFALTACMLQICLVYYFSLFYKLQGPAWQTGTALFYSLQGDEFHVGALSDLIMHNQLLVWAGTYATLIYQSAFPWLIWQRQAKYPLLVAAVFFHGGIALTMGLYWFSAVMLISELVFLSDEDYFAILSWVQSLKRKGQVRSLRYDPT